ncbi:MAG: PilC/PilY family type IV pilus protein, partial [Pseudomonadota bacterium]
HAQTSADFAAKPPLISESAPPNVMLVMSDDHELYKKAYSDFSDIDGDGLVDAEYKDQFTYSGYFNSNFCYNYDTTDTRFEPAADITALLASTGHSCASVAGDWSGNFLNWAAMTRMDIIRDVLFGGKRIVDTATSGATPGVTEIERAFLPEDVHSFVKVFEGTTQNFTPFTETAISICSTTFDATANAPVLRVANGKWALWASSEVVQCHYRSEQDSGLDNQPTATDRPATYSYDAQIQVCVPGMDAASSSCKPYTTAAGVVTYKPFGLLQQYGDNKSINFGLITGSYTNKVQGGVLRKDILPLTGNAIATRNEIDLTNGKFINQLAGDAGIINTISRLRIINWSYSSNKYSDCASPGITKAEFLASTAAINPSYRCLNWGNPLSEIYLEALRYFTGDQVASAAAGHGVPTADFNTSDATLLPSLPQLAWNDPLDVVNACASCSIIVLSTGLNSFDKDGLGSITDIGLTTATLDALVNKVGDLESITNGSYLIGDNGVTNDGSCTAKTIPHLAAARGICPEIGSLEGGFDIAGLAFHAFTKDMRNDLSGLQNVSTYSVALAQNLPSFQLAVNGKTVTFAPICQSNSTSGTKLDGTGWTNCSFVDAKIESQTATGGRMYVAWEDSLWGNDFDMDAVSRIEWCIGTVTTACPGVAPNENYGTGYAYADFAWKTTGLTANTIQFRTSTPLAKSGYAMRMGFTISGVGNSGTVTRVTNTPTAAVTTAPTTASSKNLARGTQGNGDQYFLLKDSNYEIKRLVSNSGNRIIYHEPLVYTADANVTAGKVLKNPLFFTAKYGSFNDLDKDGTPRFNNSTTDSREWDTRSTNGSEVADGIPDNYFPIANPNQLNDSLSEIFRIIASRVSSGTAAAVVANSSSGLGSVYQAYYHPEYSDTSNVKISWGGVLHSLFFDDSGRFREDNGVRGKLEDTSTDFVVDFFYDTSVTPNRTRYRRYVQSGSVLNQVAGAPRDLEVFGSIWNARDVLADISQTDILQQRTVNQATREYSEDAGTKRYIFTYLDNPSSGTPGVVDSSEIIDFSAANFNPANGNNYRYLGLGNSADAMNLVNYIRGQDKSGWRSRLVDIPGDNSSTPKYWVLGDIVHSSPLVVSPPDMRYDISSGDETYAAFKEHYQHRRQMVYAGGNDGMLHAFNAGVWAPEAKEFKTRNYNPANGNYDQGQSHELGAEMWAYVPMNLLPHLQWLKEVNYPHVYYVDGAPQAFDVNIFPKDATHPNGWGTILVVGMRLGGGDLAVDLNGDAIKETTMRSAIVILDITDPEQVPKLLAEVNTPDLNFTTSMPTLAKVRLPNGSGSYVTPSRNTWMLVFGSGPDDLHSAVSLGQDAKLFAYDLVARSVVTVNGSVQAPASDPFGFYGDLKAVDWNDDLADEAIFVGTVEGSEAAPAGRMKRVALNQSSSNLGLADGSATMRDVINMGQPVVAAPSIQQSISKKENWLLFGTGRLFTSVDNRSTTQQSFFGIKEPKTYSTMPSTLSQGLLVDSTQIIVEKNGNISRTTLGSSVTIDSTVLPAFSSLYAFMDNKPGWVHKLKYSGGTNPSERVFNSAVGIGSSVIFTTYIPSVDLCTVEGNSFLYALNFRTGTAEKFAPFGADPAYPGVSSQSVDLGIGASSGAVAIVSTGTDPGVDGQGGGVSIVTTDSTGDNDVDNYQLPPDENGRISWEQLDVPF